MEQCSSLHHLSLSSCDIGDEGAVTLARALGHNHTLRTLDLGHNSISDLGVEQLGNALAVNNTLRGLSLWKNRVFHSGAEALAGALATNSTLQWLGVSVYTKFPAIDNYNKLVIIKCLHNIINAVISMELLQKDNLSEIIIFLEIKKVHCFS